MTDRKGHTGFPPQEQEKLMRESVETRRRAEKESPSPAEREANYYLRRQNGKKS